MICLPTLSPKPPPFKNKSEKLTLSPSHKSFDTFVVLVKSPALQNVKCQYLIFLSCSAFVQTTKRAPALIPHSDEAVEAILNKCNVHGLGRPSDRAYFPLVLNLID